MDEPTIPSSIADIDASWMAAAVGQPITGVNHEQIGEGVGVSSAVYRSTLEGGDLDSVVVKLPALAEEAVFTSTVLRMYIREVRFFENLAHQSPIRGRPATTGRSTSKPASSCRSWRTWARCAWSTRTRA